MQAPVQIYLVTKCSSISLILKRSNRFDWKKQASPGISLYERSAVTTNLLSQILKVRPHVIGKIIPFGFTKSSSTSPVTADSVGASEQNQNYYLAKHGSSWARKFRQRPSAFLQALGAQVSLQTLPPHANGLCAVCWLGLCTHYWKASETEKWPYMRETGSLQSGSAEAEISLKHAPKYNVVTE